MTTSEPALPRPLVETGTVRRLGAEIVEYPVGPDDAIVGQLVRELGLPRDALLSVIVRGDEALLPRGSTRIEAADRLHVMVREEVAEEMDDLLERWRVGPGRAADRAASPMLRSGSAVFSTRPVDRGRRRRRLPARGERRAGRGADPHAARHARRARACWWTAASRAPGPQLALGGPLQLQRYARRRLAAEEDAAARAWWQEVIGALAR